MMDSAPRAGTVFMMATSLALIIGVCASLSEHAEGSAGEADTRRSG